MAEIVALVDYGAGNLHSVENALKSVGAEVRVTADPDALHLFHNGQSLLYRDGDLPPYQPRTTPSGSMGSTPAGDDRQAPTDGIIKPEGPVR